MTEERGKVIILYIEKRDRKKGNLQRWKSVKRKKKRMRRSLYE